MSTNAEAVVDTHDPVARQTQRALQLLAASVKRSYDPRVDLDWESPLAEGKWFVSEKRCTLYGTDYWDELTLEQRLVCSREELAASIALGVWTEHMLLQMVARYVYDRDVATPQAQFALTEAADEVRHMMMFAGVVRKTGSRTYPTPRLTRESGRLLKTFAPVGWLWALLFLTERIFDRIQREMASDESVQPLVREMSRIHAFEESRHISFARAELETFVPGLSRLGRFAMQMMLALVVRSFGDEVFNAEMYRRAGLDPRRARRAAQANPRNRETFRWAAAEAAEYFRSVGLIGRVSGWIWRRAGFL
jgi:hypothetical protein